MKLIYSCIRIGSVLGFLQWPTDSAHLSKWVGPLQLLVIKGVDKGHGEDTFSLRLSLDVSNLTGDTTQSG